MKRKILFIGGSLNQTTMMYQISRYFRDDECWFSAYYGDEFLSFLSRHKALDFTILGGRQRSLTENFFKEKKLNVDYRGVKNNYDMVFTGSDLIIPKNIKDSKIVLVQEGMTDPENIMYYLVKYLKLPRWAASTSTTGMSDEYDIFCVASEGYKEHFINKGADPDKILVTGIPNFDNCVRYYDNDFPHKNFVLAATSDSRETYRYENRKKFIRNSLDIADGRKLVFKLHPNENFERAIAEIKEYAPQALIYTSGNIHEMIANSDVLITKFSTVVYTGLALGKEVYSEFDMEVLKKLTPLQNGGASAERIAIEAKKLLNNNDVRSERREKQSA